MTALCLACHKEIAWLVQHGRGLHAGVREQRCASCHPDHAGRDFALISWPDRAPERFDHDRARWPLDGSHAKAKCVDCHKAALRLSRAAKLSPRRGPDWGWVGLERECVSCHEDVHRGRLGTACADCHVTTRFTTINRAKFDHDRTRYPLRGRHAAVACDKCHDFSAGKVVRNPPFASCTDCHRDSHAGTATLAGRIVDCASCHIVDDWRPSTYTVAQHEGAAFALSGKHRQVRCSACHTPVAALAPVPVRAGATPPTATTVGKIRMPFTKCTSCHADVHGGQLASRLGNGACEECHRDAGWKPSVFSTAAHARLRLALEGRHSDIPCASCHSVTRTGLPPVSAPASRGTAKFLFAVPEIECASCHVDPHAGRFAAGSGMPVNGGCRACHDAKAFRPSTVDVSRHAAFKFPLEGAHRAPPCVACHTRLNTSLRGAFLVRAPSRPPTLVLTAEKGTACQSCHETPHGSQFAARKNGGRCESCHGTEAFAPATRFDHERDATFSLKGAHAKLACVSCHTVPAGSKQVVYRPLSSKCESCHAAKTAGGGK